jgi:4-alpha-glucanotransferase
MEHYQFLKQMTQFNKTAFDSSYNAMCMFREHNEKMATSLLDQATWMPEEGKKAINDWVNAYKKGREDFKKVVDENFKKVEDFFSAFDKDQKTKK